MNLQWGKLPDVNLTVWTKSIPPNSYTEALAPTVMVQQWVRREITRFRRGHEGGRTRELALS